LDKTNKKDLENLVSLGMTLKEMAKELKCSQTNVRYWLKKYDLRVKRGPRGKLPKDFIIQRKCGSCGETDPNKFYGNKKFICAKCHTKYVNEVGRKNRQYALDLLGNKCIVCGFDKYNCSLDLHHVDPTIKDPNFSGYRSWSSKRIEKEVEKCVLLCRNCHAAVHNNEIDLNPYLNGSKKWNKENSN
jgi:hypothetical protein